MRPSGRIQRAPVSRTQDAGRGEKKGMGWREWEEKGEGNEEKNEVEGGGGEGGRGVGEKEKEKEKERENWAEGELGG